MGKPVRLHPETELCTNFEEAKVFVNADMTKELPKLYQFKSKNGIKAAMEFSYPWLPKKCSFCSKWGHPGKECTKSKTKDSTVEGNQSVRSPTKRNLEGSPERNNRNLEVVVRKEPKEKVQEDTPMRNPNEKETPEMKEVGEDTAGETEVVLNLVSNRPTVEVISTSSPLEDTHWNQVSPGKIGRTLEIKHSETVISPSRFQLLADDEQIDTPEEEEQNVLDHSNSATLMDEVEEGEILSKEEIVEDAVNKEGKAKKNRAFRAAKTMQRASSYAAAISTRESKPGGTSKKRSSKHH